MKNRIFTIGAIGIGVFAGYMLGTKNNRSKLKDTVEDVVYKIQNLTNTKDHSILEDAGIPDQVDSKDHAQLENAKMVSEGSQYGVNYYNIMQEENFQ